jgi:predicted ester cyclase
MTTVEQKQTMQKYVDSVNQGKLSIINELCDKNYVYHGIGEESRLSKDAYLKFLNEVRQAFQTSTYVSIELIAEDERVAYRMTISGTHKGEFKGLAPTGKRNSLHQL